MPQPQKHSQPSVLLILFGAVTCLALVAGGWWLYMPRPVPTPGPNSNESEGFSRASFDAAVEAVAAAEDLDYKRALDLWTELVEQYPDENAFRINQGVTVLKWIDETSAVLSTGSIVDPEEIARLNSELKTAYTFVESAIDVLTKSEAAGSKVTLLQASLLSVKAGELSYPEDEELQRQAAQLLATELEKEPAQPILAAKLDTLVQLIGGEDSEKNSELAATLREAMYASWKKQPRNLLLLCRTLVLMLSAKDERLVEALDYSMEVTRPMWSEVARSMQQLKPVELIPKIKSAVAAGDWEAREIRRVRNWVYVIKAMRSAYQPDRKLVEPDVLALLDTTFLTRLSSSWKDDASSNSAPPVLEPIELDLSANLVYWFDVDIDLDFDLTVLHGSKISIHECEEGVLTKQPASSIDIGFEATGALVAEFFAVDSPDRRKSQTVLELMQEVLPSAEDNSTAPGESVQLTPEQQAIANRHDTLQELFVWGKEGVSFVLLSQDGEHQLVLPASPTGMEEVKGTISACVFDLESDGDLDLFLMTEKGPQVWQNNGNRTFVDVSEYSIFDAITPAASQLVSCDFDNDLDQDVLCCNPGSPHIIYFENILHGQFRQRLLDQADWPELESPVTIDVAELDGNTTWDVVVGGLNETQSTTTRSGGTNSLVPLTRKTQKVSSRSCIVQDFNNDGWVDIASGNADGLSLSLGFPGGLRPAESIDAISAGVDQFDVMDFDNDGTLDIALVTGGKVVLLKNNQESQQYLNARVRGRNDDNGGGRINYFAVGTTLEVWTDGRHLRRVVSDPVTHFGLGEAAAQNLRIVFPNGLTQNLETPPVNTLVQEVQELKGSCPFVYGWNGERFELITDLLWNAPLGLQVARGETMADRRWEYLALPAELMREKDGYYELRVTEELWEIAYFDHIQLTAIDHPESHQLFTNEKVGPPSIAQPQLFLAENKIFPKAATDSKSRDVVSALRHSDQNYAQAFDSLICQGLTEPHFIELDFNGLLPDPSQTELHLFLRGWMHPTDTSLNIGLSQNPDRDGPEPPSLWVLDEEERWVCAQPFTGFPGGKPKSIVIDLEGVFRSNDHRLRIASSQQIYWDQAFISADTAMGAGNVSTPQPNLVSQALELESANLHFRGFSRLMERTIHQPHWYDYEDVSPMAKWPDLEGPFTAFGDVKELLQNDDDKMVVMTSGDEMVLRFRPPPSPLPNGWRRDFVLHSTGWDKDADLNTISGTGSLPLPFKNQKGYPAPPDQEEEAREVFQKNADNLKRVRQNFAPVTRL